MAFPHALVAFLIGVVFATFLEYVVHRLMHAGKVFGRKHAEHHRDGFGQGFVGEFWDYAFPATPLLPVGFLHSASAGIGFLAGGLLYAAFAAYSHQLQHERPELCFWLKRPIHFLHHDQRMWHHNFGITVDVWDRVFGTYKAVEWKPGKRPFGHRLRDFFRIRWL